MVGVAHVEPQAAMVRRGADEGAHVRGAGAAAHPGGGLDGLAQRPEGAGDAGVLLGLGVVGRGVGQGQVHAGGEADAVFHGGHDEPRRAVADGEGQGGVFCIDAEMQVIAAFGTQRQAVAEFFGQRPGVGAERQHHVAGVQAAAVGQGQQPAGVGWLQGHGVGTQDVAAAGTEEVGIALHQFEG